jgi:hypothetical protein
VKGGISWLPRTQNQQWPPDLENCLFANFKKYVKVTATHSESLLGILAVSTLAPAVFIVRILLIFPPVPNR